MQRRSFLRSLAAGAGACLARPRISEAALPKAKITKVNIYDPPNPNRLFNQSNMVVTVETDAGLTGIGEGAAKFRKPLRGSVLLQAKTTKPRVATMAVATRVRCSMLLLPLRVQRTGFC